MCDGDKLKLHDFVRIPAYEYVHVNNLNTNVTVLVLGPKTYVCTQNERLLFEPRKMLSLTKMQYCVIRNPVVRDSLGNPILDQYGQVKNNLGDEEYRFHQEPFALYPGEKLVDDVHLLPVVAFNTALRLQALVNFTDNGTERIAGEEWLFKGPACYKPRKEVKILRVEEARVIGVNSALCLEAIKNCTDSTGTERMFGIRWLVQTPGAYLPGPYEKVIELRNAHILTDTIALHVRALAAHTDNFGKKRRYGEEWLITRENTESHICSVNEELVTIVDATILTAQQYCVICDPWDDNDVPQLGRRVLVRGEKSFFLKPGERLERGVESVHVLQNNEGLVLKALQAFEDVDADSGAKILRNAGTQWMVRGPLEYVPPIKVEVVEPRWSIPLDKNEGIYVRNLNTGQIRAVIGESYMLNEDEELWEKKLPDEVIRILARTLDPVAERGIQMINNEQKKDFIASSTSEEMINTDEAQCNRSSEITELPRKISTKRVKKIERRSSLEEFIDLPYIDLTRVVTLKVPRNSAVQIYDYRAKRARVEFGPTLAYLGPDEQFTQLSLSGGKPKKPNRLQSLCLLLGPDFFTDIVVVETADHARLSLQLSYNWQFVVPDPCSQEEAAKLFSVPDFVGEACKAIASRVRGCVAGVYFDDFHKNSARIVRASVFGVDENDHIRDLFVFPQNNLHITNIDIQWVEPLDARARESLEKSVQLAIEIRTNSQEATARHEAERLEQEAMGSLYRQKIQLDAEAEETRRVLIEMEVQSSILRATGEAKAEAQSKAEADKILSESKINCAKLSADASRIDTTAEMKRVELLNQAELKYINRKNEIMLDFNTEQMEIDVNRFTSMVEAIGPATLASIANAGGEYSYNLLQSLGLESSLVTNGRKPVNLLATAHGLIGKLGPSTEMAE